MLTGLLFCASFVIFSMFVREPPGKGHVRLRAGSLIHTVAMQLPAN